MTCRCPIPTIYLDQHREVSCTCGHHAREDLGGPDDLARVRYRAKLNALRAKEWTPIVDADTNANDHQALAERIARENRERKLLQQRTYDARRRNGEIDAVRGCQVCGKTIIAPRTNQKYCSAYCKTFRKHEVAA
jgi:hypothetical protein